jgi:hypothetical protein
LTTGYLFFVGSAIEPLDAGWRHRIHHAAGNNGPTTGLVVKKARPLAQIGSGRAAAYLRPSRSAATWGRLVSLEPTASTQPGGRVMISGGRVSAAVVQAAPVAFDVEATLAKVERLTAECAGGGADLVVFPEAFVSCYPRGLTFGTAVGSRTAQGRVWFRRYWDSSVDVPGPVVDRLGTIALEHGVHMVIGVVERDVGTLYCTALFFAPSGAYLGKHRKLMPTGAERLVWGMGDGSTLPVFETPLGRLGAVICWENYMPLLRMSMYAKGIQIWCAPDGRCA